MNRLTVLLLILFSSVLLTQSQNRQIPFSLETPIISSANAKDIEPIFTFDEHTKHVSVSPDKRLLAIVSQVVDADYNILIYDMQTTEEITHIQGRMDSFRNLVWSPDSKRLAVISGRFTGGGIEERSIKTYFIAANGTEYIMGFSDLWFVDYVHLSPEMEYPTTSVDVVWDSSSDMIAVAFHNKLSVYDVTIEENIELFTTQIDGLTSVEWSSDGSYIITTIANSNIQIWGVPEAE